IDTTLPLDDGLPDAGALPDINELGTLDLDTDAPATGSVAIDSLAGGAGDGQAEEPVGGIADDLEDTLSGVGSNSAVPDGAMSIGEDDDTLTESATKRKLPIALIGGLAAVVLAVVGVGFFAPELIGLGGSDDTPKLPELPADMKADAPKDKGNTEPAPKPKDEPDAPKLGPAPELTGSNVHALPFGQLRPAVQKYASSDEFDSGLLAFGYFRLAHTFGDEEAAQNLLAMAPKKVNLRGGDELALAAQLGSMILDGKTSQAKKLGERALRGPMKNAALVEYVTGVAYQGKPPQKALKHLNRAVELDPGLVDASIARAELLFRKRGSEEEAEAALRTAVQAVPGPAIALRASKILMENGRYGSIDRIDDPVISSAQAEQMAAVDRTPFFRLLIAKNIWAGNFDAAAASAKRWAELEKRPEPFIAHGRLVSASGGDANAVLRSGLEQLKDNEDRGRMLHELGRLALADDTLEPKKRIASAEAVLEEAKALPGRDALGWTKLLEGDIARAGKQVPRAKAAYAAAGRGRARFVEPRLATLLAEGERGPNLAKLTQLERRSNDAAVTLALADALADKGNPGGASELYEKVLWSDASPRDALGSLIAWARATAAAGRRQRAYEQLQRVHESQPNDPELVGELVRLAQSMDKNDEAVSWYEKLRASEPDNVDFTVSYAGALNDAGKHTEAATVIEELHKKTPKAKSGRSLAELGRAYMEKDEVKARNLL
ncbi:MAG: tetratricopeptide repeat protein, partial [Myxococcota bacterium]